MDGDIIVLKFGGSLLRAPGNAPAAVHEIYRWYRAGGRVIAIAGSRGEQQAASFLGIELERAGIPARVIDAGESNPPVPAAFIKQLQTLLTHTPVVVIAGFGPDDRDGCDVSAMYLANVLRASRCRLLKNVDGVYEADRGQFDVPAVLQRFAALGYAESVIGRADETPVQAVPIPPTTVLILGLDLLGVSIHKRLAAMPEHFRVIGVFNAERAGSFLKVPRQTLLLESLEAAMSQHPDVVLDALWGVEPAHALNSHFLQRGASVVSVNLPLIADAGRKLNALAARCNAYLRYNGVVGGSAPMMEALRRELQLGTIHSIAAVFAGAASHILDRCSKGFAFDALVANAIAELGAAAVHEELSGACPARKLCVLARHAFGHDPDAFRVDPLQVQAVTRALETLSENCTLRLVARAWKISHRVFGQWQLEALDTRNPLAQVQPEWNRLLITHDEGREQGREVIVQGRDGIWPTTEALMADLLDVRFAHLALSKPATRISR